MGQLGLDCHAISETVQCTNGNRLVFGKALRYFYPFSIFNTRCDFPRSHDVVLDNEYTLDAGKAGKAAAWNKEGIFFSQYTSDMREIARAELFIFVWKLGFNLERTRLMIYAGGNAGERTFKRLSRQGFDFNPKRHADHGHCGKALGDWGAQLERIDND